MTAEGKRAQGDERFGFSEPERQPRQYTQLRVRGLDQPLTEAVFEGGVDRGSALADALLQLDELDDVTGP